MLGMPEALYIEPFPMIPLAALTVLNGTFVTQPEEMQISTSDVRDLELAFNHQKLDGLTLDDLSAYVAKLPAGDLEGYSSWLKVGMALHHQTDGKKDGFLIWDGWSKASSHYDYQECRDKWRTFANRSNITKPTRFDYIISRAGGRAVVDTVGAATARQHCQGAHRCCRRGRCYRGQRHRPSPGGGRHDGASRGCHGCSGGGASIDLHRPGNRGSGYGGGGRGERRSC
jgi:hypothetical protein